MGANNGQDHVAAAAAAADVTAELKITMLKSGQVTVTGPIENKILAYGLMEMAKDIILEHNKAQARLVQPAVMLPPGATRS